MYVLGQTFSVRHLHSRFEPSSVPECVTHPGNSQGRNSHRRGLKQYDRHRFLVALRLISKVSRKSDKRQEKHLLVSESLLCVGKFTEFVANHVLSDHHRDIVLPVVHQKSDTVDIQRLSQEENSRPISSPDKVWQDGTRPRVCPYGKIVLQRLLQV